MECILNPEKESELWFSHTQWPSHPVSPSEKEDPLLGRVQGGWRGLGWRAGLKWGSGCCHNPGKTWGVLNPLVLALVRCGGNGERSAESLQRASLAGGMGNH